MAETGDIVSNGKCIIFEPYGGLQYTAYWDLTASPNLGSQTSFKVRCYFKEHTPDYNAIQQLDLWSCSSTKSGSVGYRIIPQLNLYNDLSGNVYVSFDFIIGGVSGSTVVDFSSVSGLLAAFKASTTPSNFQFNIYAFIVDPSFTSPIFYKQTINASPPTASNFPFNQPAYSNNVTIDYNTSPYVFNDDYDSTKNFPVPYPDLYRNGGKLNDYGQTISFKCYGVNGVILPGSSGGIFHGATFFNVPYYGYSNTFFWYVNSWGFAFGEVAKYNRSNFSLVYPPGIPDYPSANFYSGFASPNFSPVNPVLFGTSYMYWNYTSPTPATVTTDNKSATNLWPAGPQMNLLNVPPTPKMIARNIVFYPSIVGFQVPPSNLVGTVGNLTVVTNSIIGDLQFKLTWLAPKDYSSYASLASVVYFTVNIYDGIYVDLVDSIVFNDNTGVIRSGATTSPLTVSSHKMQANSPYYVSVFISYKLSDGTVISNPYVAPVAPGMRMMNQLVLADDPVTNQASLTTGNVVTFPVITEVTTKSNSITVKWDYNYIPDDRQGIRNIYVYVIQNLLSDGNGPQLPAPNTSSDGYLVPLNADGSDPKIVTITDLPPGTYYAFIATYYNSTQNIKDYYTYLNPFTIPITATSVSTPQVLGNSVSQVNPSTPNQNGIKLYVTPSVYNDGSTGPGLPASYYNLSAANTSYYFQQYTQPGKYVTLLPELSVTTTLSTDTDGSSYYFWPSSNNPVDNVTLQNGQDYEFYATAVYVDADGNTYTSSLSEPSESFAPVSKTPDVPLGFTGAVNGNTVTLYLSKNPTGVYGDVTAGYLFNFNNPSVPIFDSANLISGNGPNNTTSYYIPQSIDVGSYTVSATAYDLNNVQSASSPTISLEITPQSPPDITSVKVFPGQNSYSVYWTVDPVVDLNTQISPTYFLVSYRIHGETGEGTELAYSNMYAMTTQVGGTLDSVSQFPNGTKAIVNNYPFSAKFHLDTTGNTLYDFKVTPYSVITIPGKESPTTSSNRGLWDTNDGDGYSMANAQLGSLSPISVTVSYNSNQINVTTNWTSLVGANIYKIIQVFQGGSTNTINITSNSYPTPDSDSTTPYVLPYYFYNVTSFSQTELLEIIIVGINDDTGAFSTSSGTSEFITVTQ